ncbi:hypothetical protein Clacol_009684 [Clathrus columnatus]|uniref:Uncharacterized protein n=1 Tax=Clathrus columnatus TaxID=1419009 RepID=A0AAV5API0_9AGAM|nr:hypothetical protein Clacol_009684 [Clathrus columnatus]
MRTFAFLSLLAVVLAAPTYLPPAPGTGSVANVVAPVTTNGYVGGWAGTKGAVNADASAANANVYGNNVGNNVLNGNTVNVASPAGTTVKNVKPIDASSNVDPKKVPSTVAYNNASPRVIPYAAPRDNVYPTQADCEDTDSSSSSPSDPASNSNSGNIPAKTDSNNTPAGVDTTSTPSTTDATNAPSGVNAPSAPDVKTPSTPNSDILPTAADVTSVPSNVDTSKTPASDGTSGYTQPKVGTPAVPAGANTPSLDAPGIAQIISTRAPGVDALVVAQGVLKALVDLCTKAGVDAKAAIANAGINYNNILNNVGNGNTVNIASGGTTTVTQVIGGIVAVVKASISAGVPAQVLAGNIQGTCDNYGHGGHASGY